MKNGQVFFPYQGDQEIQRWVNTCTYSTRLGLETIPWDVAFHFHKRQYRVLPAWLIFLVCFHFIQFPMGQHCHNLVSHPAFHLAIILLHLDNSQNTPWWSWAYEKVNSHGSWNIFCHPKNQRYQVLGFQRAGHGSDGLFNYWARIYGVGGGNDFSKLQIYALRGGGSLSTYMSPKGKSLKKT